MGDQYKMGFRFFLKRNYDNTTFSYSKHHVSEYYINKCISLLVLPYNTKETMRTIYTKQSQVKVYFKKGFTLLLVFLFYNGFILAQSVCYDNFEGAKSLNYVDKSGVLDSLAKNPAPGKVDSTAKCAMYVRNASKKFDNIKMKLLGNLYDVESYATYTGIPPKIKMKIYTTAPAGTLVEILLGNRGRNNEYPAGTHSQYQAYTTVSNGWEVLEFKFSQIPQGSETSANQIDQVTLLFNPNSSNSDTYYFDDITGPPVVANPTEEKGGPMIACPPKKDNKK